MKIETKIDLERVARAALIDDETFARAAHEYMRRGPYGEGVRVPPAQPESHLVYAEAAHPKVMLALVARIRELEIAVSTMADNLNTADRYCKWTAEIKAARAIFAKGVVIP